MIIGGDRSITYPEIHAPIACAASGFRALGLGGGRPVAMMLRNDFALFEVSGGAAALGSPVGDACRYVPVRVRKVPRAMSQAVLPVRTEL